MKFFALTLLFVSSLGTVAACGARTGLPLPEPCPNVSATAAQAPLDVFFLVDSSGSMTFVTASGKTKWASIRAALDGFLHAPASDGVGVAITFFPRIDATIPAACTTDGDCGKPGACHYPWLCLPDPNGTPCSGDSDCAMGGHCKQLKGACLPSVSALCATNADCTMSGDQCQTVGACSDNSLCIPGMASCASGACGGIGACANHTFCDAGSYATPVQPIASLPGAAAPILAAFDARMPDGATPTLPAVTGAIDAAKAWAAAHPTHEVVVIFATDGLPTLCDPAIPGDASTPEGVAHVAGAAGAGVAAGIDTYVIGVFAPNEEATSPPSLNEIAMAGGTGSAFVIQTSEDVTGKLTDALTTVRERAARCTIAISSSNGAPIDLAQAHLSLKHPDGSTVALQRFASQADCTSAGYFPAPSSDMMSGAGKVVLCSDTCTAEYAAPGTMVDVVLTCDTSALF